jgi:hypothetical protein
MKHAVEMGSGAMIHIPTFIKVDLDIQELMLGEGGGGGLIPRHTDSMVIA